MAANFTSRGSSDFAWEILFHAYRYDIESGMFQVRYRYYHPALGRWPNRDPIEEQDGLNLYAFVGNDPVNRNDEHGLKTLELAFGFDATIPPIGTHDLQPGEVPARVAEQVRALEGVIEKCKHWIPDYELSVVTSNDLHKRDKWLFGDQRLLSGDYIYRLWNRDHKSRFLINNRRIKGSVIKVLVTDARIIAEDGEDAVGVAAGRAIGLGARPQQNTLAHELGHVANWLDEKTGDVHSEDPNNIMYKFSGSDPDCQWCKKVRQL